MSNIENIIVVGSGPVGYTAAGTGCAADADADAEHYLAASGLATYAQNDRALTIAAVTH